MTLGLCMIVKNEAAVLARCLNSVAGVFDEIVIVDTGSTDATKEIATKYTPYVYDFVWRYNFAAARNESFTRAHADYLMWLDADDVLLETDRAALTALKQTLDGSIDAYYLRYNAGFDENGNVTLYYDRERIVRRACGFLWKGAVHEVLLIGGKTARADIAVTHRRGQNKEQGRNLRIFARLFANGTMPDERQKFYFARELMDSGLYDTAASVYEHFLQGDGWNEDKICACRDLSFCHRECGRKKKQLAALLQSFAYAPPRAETCCALGDYYRTENDYPQAIFWYKLALNEGVSENGGFVYPDYGGYIPCMWLCVCYDRLGDAARARAYNERAGSYKPNDANYWQNKRYFELSETTKEKKHD